MNPAFTVYSRPGCHLCEQLVEELLPLVRGRATVTVQNIDEDPALLERYGLKIPVVELEGRPICQFQLDRRAILESLEP